MATATPRRHTPDDLLDSEIRPMPELLDGRLVRRPLLGQRGDCIAANLICRLHLYSDSTLPGLVNGSRCGFQISPDDPEKVRVAHASFTRRDRLPGGEAVRGHARVRPDLVAEVISRDHLAGELRLKICDYLDAGIPLILCIYPSFREVDCFHGDGSVTMLRQGDTIEGGDVLPGFSCPVSALFGGI